MGVECVVAKNCRQVYDCTWCENYSQYFPENKKILSPAQKERKKQRKLENRLWKKSELSKRGKQARNSGRYAEKGISDLLKSWGFEVSDTVMSGQLKTYAETFGKRPETEEMFEGDKWVTLLGKKRKLENKKRTWLKLKGYYNKTLIDRAVIVGDSFVMMNQVTAHALLLGAKVDETCIPDKRFKFIHECFEQDNSSIVTLVAKEGARYKPYIFCFKKGLYDEFKQQEEKA
jgi:hypothetical protein